MKPTFIIFTALLLLAPMAFANQCSPSQELVYKPNIFAWKVGAIVEFEFDISKEGSVVNPEITKSASAKHDKYALGKIKQYRYAPCVINGEPVPQEGVRASVVIPSTAEKHPEAGARKDTQKALNDIATASYNCNLEARKGVSYMGKLKEVHRKALANCFVEKVSAFTKLDWSLLSTNDRRNAKQEAESLRNSIETWAEESSSDSSRLYFEDRASQISQLFPQLPTYPGERPPPDDLPYYSVQRNGDTAKTGYTLVGEDLAKDAYMKKRCRTHSITKDPKDCMFRVFDNNSGYEEYTLRTRDGYVGFQPLITRVRNKSDEQLLATFESSKAEINVLYFLAKDDEADLIANYSALAESVWRSEFVRFAIAYTEACSALHPDEIIVETTITETHSGDYLNHSDTYKIRILKSLHEDAERYGIDKTWLLDRDPQEHTRNAIKALGCTSEEVASMKRHLLSYVELDRNGSLPVSGDLDREQYVNWLNLGNAALPETGWELYLN